MNYIIQIKGFSYRKYIFCIPKKAMNYIFHSNTFLIGTPSQNARYARIREHEDGRAPFCYPDGFSCLSVEFIN